MSEPVTAATDYALAAVAVYWAWRVRAAWPLWAAGLAALAVGGVLGGTWHAARGALAAPAAGLLWRGATWALGASGFLFVLAAARRLLDGAARAAVVAVAALELAVFLAWTARDAAFVWVGLHLGLAMVAVFVLHALRRPEPRILAGVATALVAGAVQQSDLRVGPHVGPNDLYHVIGIVAVILLGAGAERVGRAPARG